VLEIGPSEIGEMQRTSHACAQSVRACRTLTPAQPPGGATCARPHEQPLRKDSAVSRRGTFVRAADTALSLSWRHTNGHRSRTCFMLMCACGVLVCVCVCGLRRC
jgi:hypothetical protein